METEQNKQLLQHIYAEVSKGNGQALLDRVADDVKWTIIGTTALSGTFYGKQDAIDKLLKPLRTRLADGPMRFTVERIIAEGEYAVMQAHGQATSKSGKPYSNRYCIVYHIVDGKLKEITEYVDTELVTSVLGA